MRLTPEEILEINRYLFNALKQKSFDVILGNNSGAIKKVSKFGVECLPGVCQSYVDGKQSYSYMCITSGTVDPSDLGYFCKNNTKCSISKYSKENPTKIDIRNYKKVVDTFVNDLNTDYTSIVKSKIKGEGLSSKVKIKATGDVFDGKYGMLESETDDMATVLVNFDDKGHKVRQNFKKDNIERIETEILNEESVSPEKKDENKDEVVDIQPMEITDEKKLLLAQELNLGDPYRILTWAEHNGQKSNHKQSFYIVLDETFDTEDSEYLVLNAEEAKDYATEAVRNYIEDNGVTSFDYYMDYVDTAYFDDYMRSSERDYIDNMSDAEVIDEAKDLDILKDSDFLKNEGGEIIEYELESHVDIDDVREKLLKRRLENYRDGIEWFRTTYSDEELATHAAENDAIEVDRMISDIISNGYGEWIASYDGDERVLSEDSKGVTFYAYRIN